MNVNVSVMCRSRKVVDNMFINDLSKMQYKNTNKGAADESLAWSQIGRARVVIKEKENEQFRVPATL